MQLHLEHRVAQRLLSRFNAHGLVDHDLSKACLTNSRDGIARVILLGRVAVYGQRAARLHEEIVPITARWVDPDVRKGPLTPFGRAGEQTSLRALQGALDEAGESTVPDQVQKRLLQFAQADITDLLPHLEGRADKLREHASTKLDERAKAESASMTELLLAQRARISEQAGRDHSQMRLPFNTEEDRQWLADRNAWERRLDAIEAELESEPKRIADIYTIRADRIDPIGLLYLWPRTG